MTQVFGKQRWATVGIFLLLLMGVASYFALGRPVATPAGKAAPAKAIVVAQMPMGPGGGGMPGMPGMGGAPAGETPAAPSAPAEAAKPAKPSSLPGLVTEGEEQPVYKGGVQLPSRPDPFKPFLPPPPPPPPPPPAVVMNPLPSEPLQSGGIRPYIKPGSAAAETKRVAGILWGERPSAVIVSESGDTFVVSPGETVNGDTLVGISRDAVYVKDARGRRWEVKLRGALPSSRPAPRGTSSGTAGQGLLPGLAAPIY